MSTAPDRAQDGWLDIGYVARVRGLRGELVVKTFDPQSEALFEVDRISLRLASGEERLAEIAEVKAAGKELVLHLAGVSTREGAEALIGSTVRVAREELEPPGEGEYFQGDLVGLAAFDEQGNALGEVAEVWDTGPVPNLVIRGAGTELLIPFADEFVPEVDLARRRVVVRPLVLSE